jgi:hypothetical protein
MRTAGFGPPLRFLGKTAEPTTWLLSCLALASLQLRRDGLLGLSTFLPTAMVFQPLNRVRLPVKAAKTDSLLAAEQRNVIVGHA